MQKRNREINIFSISAIDLFCSGMGAIMVLMVLLMPFYRMTVRVADLDMVIVLDTTGSMKGSIDQLKKDTDAIIVALQRLSKNLNVGVVAYRNERGTGPSEDDKGEEREPLHYVTHAIGPYSFREGRREKNLSILAELRTRLNEELWPGGGAGEENMQDGFNEAVGILNQVDRPAQRQVIVLVGDHGANNRVALENSAQSWLSSRPYGSVVGVYTGPPGERERRNSFQATFANLKERYRDSRRVRVTDSTGAMLGDVLEAVLEKR